MDTDPRQRDDGLGWVSRALFPDERLRLRVTGGRSARAAEPDPTALRFAVVPTVERARFLLPLGSSRVAAAAVLAYNALRPPKVRASRAATGVIARLGLLEAYGMPVLTVHPPAGVAATEVLLTAHLAALLERPKLHAAIGVRPPDPHHKPTLQLFDERGVPVGYAKVGWNDATRAMVRTEARALQELPAPSGGFPRVPRLLLATEWQDRQVAIIEPMPPGVRRLARADEPRLSAMRAVAASTGITVQEVRASSYLARLRDRAQGADPRISVAIDAVAARDGSVRVEFGRWHGDWVPWNLAQHRDELFAWDWENTADDVPVGFDLAHQAFQTALSLRGLPAAGSAQAMTAALDRYGAELGLDDDRRRFVADAYLIELWLRTREIADGGAGWNPKLHPALLDVLAERLGH